MRVSIIVVCFLLANESFAGTLSWQKIAVDQQGVIQYQKQDGSSTYVTNSVFVRLNQGVDARLFATRYGLTLNQQFEDGLLMFNVGSADVVRQYNVLLQDADVQSGFLDMVQKVRLR